MTISTNGRAILLGVALALVALSVLAAGGGLLAAGIESDQSIATICGERSASEAASEQVRGHHHED
jgi:hypothetical protein